MRKKQEEVKSSLMEAINEIQSHDSDLKTNHPKTIVDIMTFCDGATYLNLPGNRFDLYLAQRIILKTFYMGTKGNENLKLSKEEWEWLYYQKEVEERDGVEYQKNIDKVIEKLLKKEKEGFNFRELCLSLGRRSGKTILSSVISAYEAYKLLVIGNGDPHEFYSLPADDEIAIINVALSQNQAGRLFSQIQSRIRNSPFFRGRVAKETTSEIRLYTDADLEKKAKGAVLGIPGSILILCGHSNPDTMRGLSTILILFDELAHYDESGKVTGKNFYSALKPSLAYFSKFGDGRLVEISSPAAMNGIFYEVFKNAETEDQILSFQLPTWDVTPEISYEHPDLAIERRNSPDAFVVEYGAQWAKGGIYGNYFPEGLVDRCIRTDICEESRPTPQTNYYLHVDPANGGDRYVALLVAKEPYVSLSGKKRIRVRLAKIKIWMPEPGLGLMFNKIDKEVIELCQRFRVMTVSYDQWNSVQSIQLLRSHGIHVIQTSFNRGFKNKIYQNLKDMMSYPEGPEIVYYDDIRLLSELKALKYRPTMRGISLVTDKHGDVKTDDLCDALAGAAASSSENVRSALPTPVTVHTGWS